MRTSSGNLLASQALSVLETGGSPDLLETVTEVSPVVTLTNFLTSEPEPELD